MLSMAGRRVPLLVLCLRAVSGTSWSQEYDKDGFFSPWGSFSEDLVAKMRAVVNGLEAAGEVLAEQNNVTLNAHLVHEELMAAATNKAVLDALEEVLGPDIVLLHTALFAKYPKTTVGANNPKCLTVIGTHQDRQFWHLEPETLPVVSVWVAIDNVTEENGAMQMYPGTHVQKLNHVRHNDWCSALFDSAGIPDENMPPGLSPVAIELKSGQYAIFDSRTAHRSGRNTSPNRRIGLTMIYAPTNIELGELQYETDVPDWRVPIPVRCGGGACHHRFGEL